jgi:flagellar hook-length control protein FliK
MFSNGHTHAKSFDGILSMNESSTSEKSFYREIVSQVVQKAAVHFKTGENEVRITLKPEALGHLKMNIATENQQVMVRIVAEVPLAKAMIESNLGHLKSALQSQGLEIDSFDVSLASDSNHNGDRFDRPSLAEVSEDIVGEGDDTASEEGKGLRPMPVRQADGTCIVDFFA